MDDWHETYTATDGDTVKIALVQQLSYFSLKNLCRYIFGCDCL